MHTRIDLILCNQSEVASLSVTKDIFNEIERIEKLGNRFNPESEISLINRLASNTEIKITTELFSILSECVEYNRKTDGVFDVTIHSKNNYRNGINDILLNVTDQTVFFSNPNVQIDLSGYLKGYALDRVNAILMQNKFEDILINIGNSSILAKGNHPYGKGWKIKGISSHFVKDKEDCYLYNEFLTTSGNDSKERKHIINPYTGKYVEGVKEVSVITTVGVLGEVISTSFIINPEIKIKSNFDFRIL
ncbi:FAD:protein FMN transferase [Bacteroides sp. K03]|uniref:FAD:protein FMN transferase n=1 Tax=Bacteroides TaxID=816 RepID=UPI001C8B7BEC|nr:MULTISPECIES: FAD:protein FMN transferase [Bacteroides]MBX9187682.1 FAD:protein FMN transferase [Bacteroides sp. K03]